MYIYIIKINKVKYLAYINTPGYIESGMVYLPFDS